MSNRLPFGQTLYPGGAFMLCEDISEFDINAKSADDNIAPEQMATTPDPSADAAPLEKSYDTPRILMFPVQYTIDTIRDIYQDHIGPLLSIEPAMNLQDPASRSEMISTIERTDRSVVIMVDTMRDLLINFEKYITLYDRNSSAVLDPFAANMKTFTLRSADVVKQGIGSFSYGISSFSPMSDPCDYGNMLDALLISPELMDNVNASSVFSTPSAYYNEKFSKTFMNIIEFINCVCMDTERYRRLVSKNEDSCRFEDLYQAVLHKTSMDNGTEGPYSFPSFTNSLLPISRKLLMLMSRVYRKVKVGLYDLKCGLIDNEITAEEAFSEKLIKLLYNAVNLFGFSALGVLVYSYILSNELSYKEAVEEYTKTLLDIFRLKR